MESTGSYRKPIYYVPEAEFTVLKANPAHVKNLRRHKNDCKDSQWLAHLLGHGMVRASFIPPSDIRQLRDLTRRRKRLRGNGASEKNRLAKVLEDVNIKLGSVMSSLFGASGQAMLERMLKGDFHAGGIAELAQGSLKGKVEALAEALEGHRMNRHHRFLVQQCINHLRFLEEQVAALDVEIERLLEPYREVYELLQTMPGVRKESAAVLLAEAGADMSVFPTPEQFTSWAGLCPGNNKSAGKQGSGRTNRGNAWLKATLTECSWSAVRKKNSYFQRRFHRLKPKGAKKALVAVSRSMLVVAYYIMKEKIPYINPPAEQQREREREDAVRHHCKKLRQLGVPVELIRQAEQAMGVEPGPQRAKARRGKLGLAM